MGFCFESLTLLEFSNNLKSLLRLMSIKMLLLNSSVSLPSIVCFFIGIDLIYRIWNHWNIKIILNTVVFKMLKLLEFSKELKFLFRWEFSKESKSLFGILLLSKSEIPSLQPPSVVVQPNLCRTWSEILETTFLAMLLIYRLACERYKHYYLYNLIRMRPLGYM